MSKFETTESFVVTRASRQCQLDGEPQSNQRDEQAALDAAIALAPATAINPERDKPSSITCDEES
jgi:hypothetical protein